MVFKLKLKTQSVYEDGIIYTSKVLCMNLKCLGFAWLRFVDVLLVLVLKLKCAGFAWLRILKMSCVSAMQLRCLRFAMLIIVDIS